MVKMVVEVRYAWNTSPCCNTSCARQRRVFSWIHDWIRGT